MAAARAAEKAAAEAKVAAKEEAPRKKAQKPQKTARPHGDDSLLEEVVKSSAFKNAMNTAARELVKSMFKRKR
jgi:hypothetical protein